MQLFKSKHQRGGDLRRRAGWTYAMACAVAWAAATNPAGRVLAADWTHDDAGVITRVADAYPSLRTLDGSRGACTQPASCQLFAQRDMLAADDGGWTTRSWLFCAHAPCVFDSASAVAGRVRPFGHVSSESPHVDDARTPGLHKRFSWNVALAFQGAQHAQPQANRPTGLRIKFGWAF